jgi:RHS repeat-associated protein
MKYSSLSGNPPYSTTNLVSATWFNYDEEGKLVWQIQFTSGLGYKTTDFIYDVQGRLIKKIYQKNVAAEYFAHYYEYDPSTQELWKTYTNTNADDQYKIHQATYIYYLHGPLKRIEVAVDPSSGQGLQGIDYTYTLLGALKAVNNSDKTKDPNQDGIAGGNTFYPDAFGMVLDYYDGDYLNTRPGIQSIKGVNTSGIITESYSGQIKAMTWFSKKPVPLSDLPSTYVFKYDDKYQFTESVWGNTLNFSNTPASFNQTNFNQEKIYLPNTSNPAYDANGNIRFLQRTNGSGSLSDKFTYNYWNSVISNGSNTDYNTNKLQSVVHDNSGTPQTYATYTYDELGQLTIENTGSGATSKYVKYDVSGKVTAVARDAAFTQRLAEYVYNEKGSRIIKKNYNPSNNQLVSTTYYVGDVVYTQAPGNNPVADEYEIVGSGSRLGVYYRQTNVYAYELSDHLGNTRAVIAKNGSNYEVRMYADYYPYGMIIQKAGTPYRYGYQGKHAEDEVDQTGWNAFDLRMYDARIGRWTSADPMGEFWSPYLAMGNNPANRTDASGGCTTCPSKGVQAGDSWTDPDGSMWTAGKDGKWYGELGEVVIHSIRPKSFGGYIKKDPGFVKLAFKQGFKLGKAGADQAEKWALTFLARETEDAAQYADYFRRMQSKYLEFKVGANASNISGAFKLGGALLNFVDYGVSAANGQVGVLPDPSGLGLWIKEMSGPDDEWAVSQAIRNSITRHQVSGLYQTLRSVSTRKHNPFKGYDITFVSTTELVNIVNTGKIDVNSLQFKSYDWTDYPPIVDGIEYNHFLIFKENSFLLITVHRP